MQIGGHKEIRKKSKVKARLVMQQDQLQVILSGKY